LFVAWFIPLLDELKNCSVSIQVICIEWKYDYHYGCEELLLASRSVFNSKERIDPIEWIIKPNLTNVEDECEGMCLMH